MAVAPNENVLSARYATPAINGIFSEYGSSLKERELWVAVLEAQRDLGFPVPEGTIDAYKRALPDINLDAVAEREKKLRHDIKAKLEEFNYVAGVKDELLHLGMTSRDLSDNIEQVQIRDASKAIFGKYVSVLRHLVDAAGKYQPLMFTARTHHQAAQATTLGRRFAMHAEELYTHLADFESAIDDYPLRGIKGATGTMQDMINVLGSREKAEELDRRIASYLGFKNVLSATGQVYPRSLDYKMTGHLALLASACESFGENMRLMCGYELMTEGFKEGQVGSTAMPHKMNTRNSERVCGLSKLVKMYNDGASRISGDQWEEGDVSCSSPRRIIMPDIFYASDGVCETMLTVLNEMGAYPRMIQAELDKYMPFLGSTELLIAAAKKGIGRETAHKAVKTLAVKEALRMRESGSSENRLLEQLSKEPGFPLSGDEIKAIFSDRARFVGSAMEQVDYVKKKADTIISRYPKEAAYEPQPIL